MNKASSLVSPSRLAITYRPLGELIPDPRNARTHPKRQLDQIRASIEAFGFTNPVLADPEGHIIAGHGPASGRPGDGPWAGQGDDG
jgi:ParB-like nuclease domain